MRFSPFKSNCWLFILILFQLVFNEILAQQSNNPGLVKAALVYKYAQNMEWDNESSKSKYVFGVLSNDEEIIKNFKNFTGKPLKNKLMSVVFFKSIDELSKVDIVFVDVEFAENVKEILNKTKGNNTLLVSYNAADKKSVMLNMFDDAGKIKFEVNKANILSEGMHVGANLLLLGGTELDVAQLYKETQTSLQKEKETVKLQQKDLEQKELEINIKKAEILKQHAEIQKQHEEIAKQKTEIELQKAEIRIQTENLNKLKGDVSVQQIALAEKTKLLAEQVAKIKLQEESIAIQELEMHKGKAKLDVQMHQIADTQTKITKQKRILMLQTAKIGLLENLNYIFAFILFLLVGLAFFIFRSYQVQKKGKKLMEAKNAEIALFSSKLEIEKEHTMNSIKYAQTIQNAILPQESVISKLLEHFVIFRPKDIVAGDFYWFHHIEANGNDPEKILIGALDCTGHGVPGAFMSMIGTSLLNEIVKEKKITSPSEILHLLNIGVMTALKQGESDNNDGMDACLILIERKENQNNKIVFCGAKRPLLYVLPASVEIKELKGDRKNIGGAIRKVRQVDFVNQEFELPQGGMLYLTTDGFTDQNCPNRIKFGMHNLQKLITENVMFGVDIQKKAFEHGLDHHQNVAEQRDDITLIGVRL